MSSYPFHEIEKKWQHFWEEQHTYRTGEDPSKPKYYVLDMFPYPSGDGLHVGHPEGYTATDIVARFKRMTGYNVLHPMGWDAFGLPTERYSMTTGIHPITATAKNVLNFTRQLKMLGFSYDWSRQINTTYPEYYKWTQWMFTVLYNSWFDETQQRARNIAELPIPADVADVEAYKDEYRLAYIAMIPVNWCEALGTVLANEEVDEWKEKGYSVERRPMRQWMLRITKYAQRLLDDMELIDWVPSTKEMQRNWIGKSEGALVRFPILGTEDVVTVFTTRPDTIFGATYLVLAPEHPFVNDIVTTDHREAVLQYQFEAAAKSDLERTELNKSKTGVFTGGYALNPANGESIPVWIADYVLAHYGTGAIMAVPGHDVRDHEFARAYNLSIVQVVMPANGNGAGNGHDIQAEPFTAEGMGCNSKNDDVSLNGEATAIAKRLIIDWLEEKSIGKRSINFKLRDWLFSRQRYWGEPVPIMYYEDGSKRALDMDELPLVLPDVEDFKPAGTGESALATVESWVNFIDKKTGKKARYETNTMPQWAGSCWYYLRYIDPHNSETFCAPDKEKYWMQNNGVDLYVGGTEHAVLHLLYARFWHKVLYDYGYVSTREPFAKLFHQGLILGEDGRKMSKSLGNVINPDDVVQDYGADALRLFEMFLGPLEDSKPWSTKGIEGVHRFLNRVWRLIMTEERTLSSDVVDIPMTEDQRRVLHSTIKKVSEDISNLSFNTAIAQMMTFVNEFTPLTQKPREAMQSFVLVLAPFAPHIAEELWAALGNSGSVALADFPKYDETALVMSRVEIILQVNSKIRAKAMVSTDASEEELTAIALADDSIKQSLEGKSIKKIIVVKAKLVNFIVA